MRNTTVIFMLTWILQSSCLAGLIQVDAQGTGDYPTIQEAIDAAQDGDVLVLLPGTYIGDGNRDIHFKGRAITVRSQDPNDPNVVAATVVLCQGDPNQPHRGFAFDADDFDVNDLDTPSAIEGLTITGGWADYGGAIYCSGSNGPSIRNCILTANTAAVEGGGVYGSAPRIVHSRILGNTAKNGGGIFHNSPWNSIEVKDCLFIGNSAVAYGGAVHSRYANLTSCSLVGNTAGQRGGGVYLLGSSNTGVISSILWANSDPTGHGANAQIYFGGGRSSPSINASYCCIQDDDPNDANIPFGGAAVGNIDDDPRLVRMPSDGGDGWGDDPSTAGTDEGANDDLGDLHLTANSPCINTGSEDIWISPDDVDVDGQPRRMAFRIDMGVDEFFIPSIETPAPQTGEVWTAGSSHPVAWTAIAYGGLVDLVLSTDKGKTWSNLQTGLPSTGSALISLPAGTDSYECLIQAVPQTAIPNALIVPSGVFTIRQDATGPAVTSLWRSLGGDFDRKGQSSLDGPTTLKTAWTFQTGGPIWGSVTLGLQDRIHVACEDGKLYTLSASGERVWVYDANTPLINSPTVGPDGSLFVGSEDGRLLAVSVDGRLRWTYKTGGAVYSSAAVDAAGRIYVGSQDGLVYALSPDGGLLWTFRTRTYTKLSDSILASPSIGSDSTIYIGGYFDPNLYALDPNGSVRWVCPFPADTGLFASPVVGSDGTIYQTLMNDHRLYAVDPDFGTIRWAVDLADPNQPWYKPSPIDAEGWSEPVISPDGPLYVSLDDPYLRAVDPNGKILWGLDLGDPNLSIATGTGSDVVVDLGGFTLTVDQKGTLYAACGDGSLYVVSSQGSLKAQFKGPGQLSYPVVTRQGVILVTANLEGPDENGLVLALTADTANMP